MKKKEFDIIFLGVLNIILSLTAFYLTIFNTNLLKTFLNEFRVIPFAVTSLIAGILTIVAYFLIRRKTP